MARPTKLNNDVQAKIAMPELWERLESDTSKSYEAFCIYRDMGSKRSLERVGQALSKSKALMDRWSSAHNWQARVIVWDDYQDGLRIEAQAQARKQLIDDELEDYRKQLETWRKAFERTPLLEQTHRTTDKDGNTFEFVGLNISDLHQLTKWRAEIDKQARLAMSLPDRYSDNKTEVTGKVELAHQWEELMRVEPDEDDPFS